MDSNRFLNATLAMVSFDGPCAKIQWLWAGFLPVKLKAVSWLKIWQFVFRQIIIVMDFMHAKAAIQKSREKSMLVLIPERKLFFCCYKITNQSS
jgi:hypothetical protein